MIKKHAGDKGAVAALGELPSSQTSALAQTSIRAEFKDGQFKDLPGHALLHGTFRLPSIVPDRDFVWDQVAMRLPTGSVLVMGQSVNDGDEDVPECVKGHVPRGCADVWILRLRGRPRRVEDRVRFTGGPERLPSRVGRELGRAEAGAQRDALAEIPGFHRR